LALACALVREWSGEGAVDRAAQQAAICHCAGQEHAVLEAGASDPSATRQRQIRQQAYLQAAEQRFNGITRCC
jgi:hypothetical protein